MKSKKTTLSNIQSQIAKRKSTIKKHQSIIDDCLKAIERDEKLKERIIKSKKRAKETALEVSDHAAIRYIERVYGADVESLKKEMIPGKVEELVIKNGGDAETTYEGIRYVFANYKLLTVYEY